MLADSDHLSWAVVCNSEVCIGSQNDDLQSEVAGNCLNSYTHDFFNSLFTTSNVMMT